MMNPLRFCLGRWREGEADAKEHQYESHLPLIHVILSWLVTVSVYTPGVSFTLRLYKPRD